MERGIMILKYNINVKQEIIQDNIKRIINQIYKLLPSREEGLEWKKPLETIMIELAGMDRLFNGQEYDFLSLLCKLEGLYTLEQPEDFSLYRRTIFECLGLLSRIKENVRT